MTIAFGFLTVTYFFVSANSLENVYPDNGWRPMSIEKVMALQRDFIKPPNLHLVKTLQNSPKRPTVIDDFGNEKIVKIIHSNELNVKPIESNKVVPSSESYEGDSNEYPDLIRIIQPPYKEMITLGDTVSNWDIKTNSKLNQLRKAKKIENLHIDAHLNNAISKQFKSNEKTDQIDKRNNGMGSTNTYEVKENIKEENKASDQTLLFNKRLKYELPKSATVNTKNNLTANLLNILANYNIRTSDSLRNYDLSLRQNSRNLHNHDYVFMHVPVKLPIKYNNANHSPLDPLLAVFLSNYGHYIPSLYGFNGGYNNLYGYLASNNIHNNKPFGSYKIFSDTDSSH